MIFTKKTKDIKNIEHAKQKIGDLFVYGNGDAWQLVCKASSKKEGWMKSTKAMDVGAGLLIQVSTQQGSEVAEAITYLPGGKLIKDEGGNPKIIAA